MSMGVICYVLSYESIKIGERVKGEFLVGGEYPIKIKLLTTIWDGNNNKETFEFITFGQYYKKNSSVYLQYEEVMENMNVITVIELVDGLMTMTRKGDIQTKMIFESSKIHDGIYDTPLGVMYITVNTKRLQYHHNPELKEGHIDLEYDLSMGGSKIGRYHLEFSYEEEKNEYC